MLQRLLPCIFGSYTYTTKGNAALEAISLLRECSVPLLNSSLTGDMYSFNVSACRAHRLSELLDKRGVFYERSRLHGLPKIFPFLCRRPALVIGTLVLFAATYISSRVIWGFEVIGCENVPQDEILVLLDELGCGIGDYIPTVNLDRVHAYFLSMNHDISWIAVNFKGNFATVEVIETHPGATSSPPDGVYANIIASEDAQLYLLKTACGKAHAEGGDVVRKGDVLISGVIDVKEDRVRYEYAKGEALAYVPRTIELEVPFEREVKAYTGRQKTISCVKIFKKSINLFSKGGIEYSLYDKIKNDRQIYLFGKYPLPVYISCERYSEYVYRNECFTAEQSKAYAKAELKSLLDELLESCEIVSNKVYFDVSDDVVRIRYDMMCLTDIASTREFTAEK